MWPFSTPKDLSKRTIEPILGSIESAQFEKANRAGRAIIIDDVYSEDRVPSPANFELDDFLRAYGDADWASTWIYQCVNVISDNIAQIPLRFYRGSVDPKRLIKRSPLVSLFEDVNPQQTYFTFMKATLGYLALVDNAFWGLERTGGSDYPNEMWVLRPDKMEIKVSKSGEITGYVYKNAGVSVSYSTNEVIHLRGWAPTNSYWGQPSLTGAKFGILSDQYAKQYNKDFFKNGARVAGAISIEENLDDESFRRLEQAANSKFAGVGNMFKLMILEGGAKFTEFSAKPKDAEFLDQCTRYKQEVLSAFGLPPIMIADYSDAGVVSNAKIQFKMFWTSIMPRLRLVESFIQEYLIPLFGTHGTDVKVAFDTKEITALQEDQDKLSARMDRLYRGGIIKRNEARLKLGFEPDADGDIYYQQAEAETNYNAVRETFVGEPGKFQHTLNFMRGLPEGRTISKALLAIIELNGMDDEQLSALAETDTDMYVAASLAREYAGKDIDDVDCKQFIDDFVHHISNKDGENGNPN